MPSRDEWFTYTSPPAPDRGTGIEKNVPLSDAPVFRNDARRFATYTSTVRSVLTVVGVVALFAFAGELSLAIGPVLGMGFAMVVLALALIVVRRRHGRRA